MTNQKMLDKIQSFISTNDMSIIFNLKDNLLEDIRIETAKKNNPVKRVNLVKSIVKSAIKRSTSVSYSYDNKYHAFCDGYRLYCLNDSFGYEFDTNKIPLDVNKLYPKTSTSDSIINVDIIDLKTFIAENKIANKASCKNPYILMLDNGQKIGFNPQYLLEFIQIFDCNTIRCSRPVSPALIETDTEWGILLPIRIKD